LTGHAGRPSTYSSKSLTGKGIRNDLSRFGFWLALLFVFATSKDTLHGDQLSTIYTNLLNTASVGAGTVTGHKSLAEEEKEQESTERWNTILAVFTNFEEFDRAMKHDDTYQDLLQEMCESKRATTDNFFAKRKDSSTHAGETEYEKCFQRKKENILPQGSSDMDTGFHFMGIPIVPTFLVAAFALSLLVKKEGSGTNCLNTWPPTSSSGWQCSNSNMDGSTCILTCQNDAVSIRKIAWGLSNVRVCDAGSWKPPLDQLAQCAEVKRRHYEFGITRLTPEFQ